MKKITARITMSLEVTDEEYAEILRAASVGRVYGYDDVNVSDELLDKFEEKGSIDMEFGDSYIPGPWIEYKETGNC